MFSLKHYIHNILISLFLFSNALYAQTVVETDTIPATDSTFYRRLLYPRVESPVVYADTLILSTEALPFVFNKSRIDMVPLTPPLFKKYYPSLEEQFFPDKLFSDKYNRNYLYKKAYNDVLDNHKKLIRYTKKDMEGEVVEITKMKPTIIKSLFKIDYDRETSNIDKPSEYHPKRRYWIWKGNHFLQFSQTDNSGNWSNPGLGIMNFLSTHSINGTYQKNRLQITQSLEWRLNFANNPNDTVHWYKISEDKLRSYTTVGLQAYKHWAYSSNLEFTTQVIPNFVENGRNLNASFLSPFNLNVGVGMNYTLNKYYPNKKYPKLPGRNVGFMADISPLSLQYVNLLRSVLKPSQFGIQKGSSQLDLGTTVNGKLTVSITKSISYMSRIKYFTNYKRTDFEWEHDLNMPINRYFSIRLYLFAVFDDARARDPKYGHLLIQETLSFGFNYAW